jgi:hypothetical protein
MDSYELTYLRAVMEWLNTGGKYEPLDFEEVYEDWRDNIRNGKPSLVITTWHNDFVAPPRTEPAGVSTEGAAWAAESGRR